VVGRGRRLPQPLFDALLDRVAAEHERHPWEAPDEVVPAPLLDLVSGPSGPVAVPVALATADAPLAAELLRAVPRL
jgi:hypothetical protein